MSRPYVAHVFHRRGRWRADLPGAFAILFSIGFVVGLVPDTFKALGPIVLGCGAAAIGCIVLWRMGHRALKWTVTVDTEHIALANRAGKTIDLGRPTRVTHGRGSMLVTAGRAGRNVPLLWIAVESPAGTTVFQRAMGALDRVPHEWPRGQPPHTTAVYSALGFDPVPFYAAVRDYLPPPSAAAPPA